MSDYDCVARSSLKLKAGLGLSKKDKKKKKKDKNKTLERQDVEKAVANLVKEDCEDSNGAAVSTNAASSTGKRAWMTEAEKKFLAQQEKRQLSRVMEKASKSHKQRVEEFNTQLENLSEHYDIPKVSWTK